MDSGVWKTMNNQKDLSAPKMIQVNRGKFIPTERLVETSTNAALNEVSVKVEDTILHVDCANGFNAIEQDETPAVPRTQTYSERSCSVTYKKATNGAHKAERIISPSDGIKEERVDFKEEKSDGSSTQRKCLLIDNQGIPCTVVVEEPLSIDLSDSSSTSWADSTLAVVSKSLAPRKEYQCPVCFKIFDCLSYLQRHSINHSQQKPYVCKVCGKAFKRSSHLTRHEYTHFGGKPYPCQTCRRRFRDASELTRHQLDHTEEEKSRMTKKSRMMLAAGY